MNSPQRSVTESGLDKRPDQLASVASVFGEPYEVGGKMVIPVAQVRHFEMRWSRDGNAVGILFGSPISGVKPVAVIEVDQGQVRIIRIPDPLPVIIGGMIIGAWNFYWILRTIRELKARRS